MGAGKEAPAPLIAGPANAAEGTRARPIVAICLSFMRIKNFLVIVLD
jgi:hypothetical protein